MQEHSQEQNSQSVTNPFQGASEIFYHPSAVFKALGVKDNWSWIPFILIVSASAMPIYLYFNMVDFDWYRVMIANMQMPDGSPAEIEAFSNTMELGATQLITMVSIGLGLPIVVAILAGYFTLWTRNDAKGMQGFTDWYGATWWMMMPSILNALLACLYLLSQESGTALNQSALAPLSIAFVIGTEMTAKWYSLLSSIRLDSLWTIALGAICLNVWTNFSKVKSVIVAAIPSALIWTITIIFTL